MTTRIRRALLFARTLPLVAYAELESQRLQHLAARGVPVAERRLRLERRVAQAIARIDREVQ